MKRFWSSFLIVALFALLAGCATNEPDNASVRPWDSPQGWENGVPSQMYQQNH